MNSKMYIAVLDEVGDFMVPTLVAHSVLNAHVAFTGPAQRNMDNYRTYTDWLALSFKKVVIRVNRKEFEKIRTTLTCWEGHENTTLSGEISCLVVLPVQSDNVPNVLKYAKMWKPKEAV